MNIRAMTSGLAYCGEVEAKRQTYYVFEGKRHYLVLSFSRSKPNAGNFNFVDAGAVEYVRKRFAGAQAITAKEVHEKSRKPNYVNSHLHALNVLYVLVAIQDAHIDGRFKGRSLYFNIR